MSSSTNRKFLALFNQFTLSHEFNQLCQQREEMSPSSLNQAVDTWLKETELTNTETPNYSSLGQCQARCYNGKGELDGKICKRSACVTIDGVHVCNQHATHFKGSFKGHPDKKQTVGFCAACTNLTGVEVIHNCPLYCLLGTLCGTSPGVCQARLQDHTDFDGPFIRAEPSKRGRKKKQDSPCHPTNDDESDLESKSSPTNDDESNDDKSNDDESDLDDDDVPDGVWYKITCDLENTGYKTTYWAKNQNTYIRVFTYEKQETKRIYLGTISEDDNGDIGFHTPD